MRVIQIIFLLLVSYYSLSQPKGWINKKDTILYLPYQDGIATFSYNGKMGIIDSTGHVILPATFTRLDRLFYDDDYRFGYRFYSDGKKKGVLDENFNIIITAGSYDDIDILIDGFFKVELNGRYSFVDKKGKCFEKWFNDAGFFRHGMAPVKFDRKWGYINEKCELIISNIYSDAKVFSRDQLAAVKQNGKWGFINKTGKIIIPLMYQKVNFFINGNCGVCIDNLWGFIDRANNTIISFQYDDVEPFYSDLALAKKNGQYGYINVLNEIVIPFQYSKAYSFYENDILASVKVIGKWTHIDKKGNIQKMSWDK